MVTSNACATVARECMLHGCQCASQIGRQESDVQASISVQGVDLVSYNTLPIGPTMKDLENSV